MVKRIILHITGIAALLIYISCDKAVELFRLVNCSDRVITAYTSTSADVSNKELFDYFHRENITDSIPYIEFSVAPKSLYRKTTFASFEYQFRAKDGLMHMYIIDVDAARKIYKKGVPDSSMVTNIVLKRFDLSKDEMEANYRTVIYCEK